MAGRKATTVERRFWEKVEKTENCWLWTAQINNRGYGCFRFRNYPWFAHRVSWILHFGEIPVGRNVLHHCDTPRCVRPDHLFIGTQGDNNHDRDQKNRVRHGERHPYAKLSEAQVREIRADPRTQRLIAAAYGIHQVTVSDIRRGKTWKRLL